MDTGFLIIAWIVSGVIGLVLGAIVDKLGAGEPPRFHRRLVSSDHAALADRCC